MVIIELNVNSICPVFVPENHRSHSTLVLSILYHATHRRQVTQHCTRSTLVLIALIHQVGLVFTAVQEIYRFPSIDLQQMFRTFLMHHSRTRPLTGV